MEETYISGELAAHLLGVSRATLERHKMLRKHFRTEEHARTGELRPVVRYAASDVAATLGAKVTDPATIRLIWLAPHRAIDEADTRILYNDLKATRSTVDDFRRVAAHNALVCETVRAELSQSEHRRRLAEDALADMQEASANARKIYEAKADFAAKQAAKLLRVEGGLRIAEAKASELKRLESDARFMTRAFATIAAIQAVGAAIGVALWA